LKQTVRHSAVAWVRLWSEASRAPHAAWLSAQATANVIGAIATAARQRLPTPAPSARGCTRWLSQLLPSPMYVHGAKTRARD